MPKKLSRTEPKSRFSALPPNLVRYCYSDQKSSSFPAALTIFVPLRSASWMAVFGSVFDPELPFSAAFSTVIATNEGSPSRATKQSQFFATTTEITRKHGEPRQGVVGANLFASSLRKLRSCHAGCEEKEIQQIERLTLKLVPFYCVTRPRVWRRDGGRCFLKRKKTQPILLSEAKSREARDAHLTGGPLMGDPFFCRAISGQTLIVDAPRPVSREYSGRIPRSEHFSNFLQGLRVGRLDAAIGQEVTQDIHVGELLARGRQHLAGLGPVRLGGIEGFSLAGVASHASLEATCVASPQHRLPADVALAPSPWREIRSNSY